MDIITPPPAPQKGFTNPEDAWAYLAEIYHRNTGFIRQHLIGLSKGAVPKGRVRAFYPEVQVTSRSYGKTDSTLAYGYLHTPGIYRTTITAPDLFKDYLQEQFSVILRNHGGAHRSRGIVDAHSDPFRAASQRDASTARRSTPCPFRCATCSTCRTCRTPTTKSPTALSCRRRAGPTRWRISPRRASTIRSTGSPTTPGPRPTISRIS